MKSTILKTEQEYYNAIKILEDLGDDLNFENDPQRVEKFEFYSKLISDYEKLNFDIASGHPIEIIKLRMEQLGLNQKALEPCIGVKSVVSEVLNRKRGLTKQMIRNLASLLKIDQEILNTEYDLVEKPKSMNSSAEVFVFSVNTKHEISNFKERILERGRLFPVYCNSNS